MAALPLRHAVWLGPVALVLLGVVFLMPHTSEACSDENSAPLCFINETGRIAEEEGVAAALTYVEDTVRERSNYKIVHMAMHMAGHHAYVHTEDHAGDVARALSYLPKGDEAMEHFLDFNGYLHGVLEHFFSEHRDWEPTDLITQACAQFMSLESLEKAGTWDKIFGPECLHATGHSLMFILDNDVPRSLAECDKMPRQWMRDWCHHGVFMENHYLHLPMYLPDAPRPYATGDRGLTLCHTLDEKYRAACSQFVGWIYIEMNRDDFAGAFAACSEFPENERRICIARTARFQLAASGISTEAMIQTCVHSPHDTDACLAGAAVGIREGLAGIQQKTFDFCGHVPEEFRTFCSNTVARYKESLARIYVVEL
jgi:hypothetical protein